MKNFLKNFDKITILAISIFSLSVINAIVIPIHISEASSYTLLEPLPCVEGGGVSCPGGNGSTTTTIDFKNYVQYTFNLLIALAAVAAVVMIVWGGIEYMASSSFKTKSDGKSKITNAILGLVLVLCSYLILKTINPELVNISSDLVPQIKLVNVNNASKGLFDKLSEDANNYNFNTAQLGSNLDNMKLQISTLQSDIDNLKKQQDQIAANDENDPKLASIESQIQDKQNQIYDVQAKAVALNAEFQMAAYMNQGNVGNGQNTSQVKTLNDVHIAQDRINAVYNDGLMNMQIYGADSPAEIQALNDNYYRDYGSLILQESVLLNAPRDGIEMINSQVKTGMLDKIKDPDLKTQLQADIDRTMIIHCNPNFGDPNNPSCKK